jgi:hypothetical protein
MSDGQPSIAYVPASQATQVELRGTSDHWQMQSCRSPALALPGGTCSNDSGLETRSTKGSTEGANFGVARFGSDPKGPNKSAQGVALIVYHKS